MSVLLGKYLVLIVSAVHSFNALNAVAISEAAHAAHHCRFIDQTGAGAELSQKQHVHMRKQYELR